VLTPDVDVYQGGEVFTVPHKRLWEIVRRRNFETSVIPAYKRVRFIDGWYGREGDGVTTWRWMGREARLALPPMPGRGKFAIHFELPMDLESKPPVFEARINGVVVDHSVCTTDDQRREFVIESKPDRSNDVVLSMSDAPSPAAMHRGADTRPLGLELREFSWTPAQ
jgi:hypothetical protein